MPGDRVESELEELDLLEICLKKIEIKRLHRCALVLQMMITHFSGATTTLNLAATRSIAE